MQGRVGFYMECEQRVGKATVLSRPAQQQAVQRFLPQRPATISEHRLTDLQHQRPETVNSSQLQPLISDSKIKTDELNGKKARFPD